MKHTLLLTFIVTVLSAPAYAQGIATTAQEALVMDFETGAILLEKNAHEKMPTSSMSKVITTYLVFEALQNGTISMDDTLPVSEKAWRMGGSKMFVDINDNIKVSDLVRGVVVQSGNDATVVLAEGLAGSESAFADALNKKAQELGMNDSHFMNASGWPDPEHYSTAHDLALLGRSLIQNFPEYYPIFSEKEFTYNSIKQGNRNPLLYRNIGADGIKTGHTEAAGYGLMASGTDGSRRVIVVLNGMSDQQERADESAKILEWGLRNFENKTFVKAGESLESAEVIFGETQNVNLATQEDITITLPKFQQDATKVELHYNSPLIAPLEQGQEIGVLKVEVPGVQPMTYPVYTSAAVTGQGWFAKAVSKAKIKLGL